MKTLAIIPARGGSKGIPRKNVLPLAGKPLIGHMLEQATVAKLVDRIVVSTDDPEIAMVSQQYGADIVWRPAEISGDDASSESALLHSLDWLKENEGYQPDLTAFLQCTAPLTLAEDIDGTVQALLDAQADSAVAVAPFHYFLWKLGDNGEAVGVNHDKNIRLLRQHRESQYQEAGSVYVMRTEEFLRVRNRFFGKTVFYITPIDRILEIDDPVDMQIAEVLIRQRDQHNIFASRQIQALVLDFDGVMTDNRVIVHEDGSEAVLAHRGDGWGIARLVEAEIPVFVISKEKNPVVAARCCKLGIDFVQGQDDKLTALQRLAELHSLDPSGIVYVGNDVNDLECMQWVGIPIAVADAVSDVLRAAVWVTQSAGGFGAVREVIDAVLNNLAND